MDRVVTEILIILTKIPKTESAGFFYLSIPNYRNEYK